MRSSKNRSRSKGNRNRSVGNIVNRVFDSSGPEGKVRGTPQQIIEKYNQLARDAQLSNDRVAAENFQQHAEHYLRMLAEAQREQEARQQFQPQHGGGGRERGEGDGQSDGPAFTYGDVPQQPGNVYTRPEAEAPRAAEPPRQAEPRGDFDAVIDAPAEQEGGLVETPEGAPKAKRSRSRRPKKPADAAQGEAGGDADGGDSPQEAAE
ncbi:DUF4167 domain-containing protein [Roseicyclus sp.]|uniref:DUF4167 domain-containing protein n=1 Tax=Roseicyclus sp. TaxID=1914329 RepID=UPI003F6B2D6B